MKKIFLSLALAALLPFSAVAQDARQRTTATIIADALDQLPADRQRTYDSVVKDLASTGADGINQLAGMLVPADKGKNATLEYALYAVVSYVAGPDKAAERAEVRKGLKESIDKCTDNANKAFLMNMLQRCATAEDAPFFVKYAKDSYLADWAINGLALEGMDDALLELMKNDGACREKLAYAAGDKKLAAAEPILIGWLKDADAKTKKAIYHALGIIGTAKSLPVLGAAAKADKYDWVPETDATSAYLRLIKNLAAKNDKAAIAAAKALLKPANKAFVRGAALEAVVAAEGAKAKALVTAALADNNRDYRVNALRLSECFADDAWYAAVAKTLKAKGDKEVKADVLNWFGTKKVASQIDAIVANINSANTEIAEAAIAAASKIGGETALNALVAQLNGKNAKAATAALLSFNGKVNDKVIAALDADKATQIAALGIASTRSMEAAADKVFAMLNSTDAETSAAAYKALAGVVEPKDFGRLCDLIEKGKHTADIQNAMKSALLSLTADKQMETVTPAVNKSSNASLYYPVLAQVGSSAAIAEILKGYNGNYKNEAFAALLTVDNVEMIDVLYNIAVNDKANAQKALARYTAMVSKSANTPVRKYQLYRKALEIATDAKVQSNLLSLLGGTNTYQALLIAEKYLDNKATAEAAAGAIRNIASKNTGNFGGEPVRKAMEKAIEVFKAIGDADAGYAIDDLKSLLQKLPEAAYAPVFGNETWSVVALNPVEKAAMKAKKIKKAEAAAAATAAQVWAATETGMAYAGGAAATMGSGKNYENFELMFEWKGEGKAGLGVRSIPQIDLGGEKSGALSGNVEGKNAPAKLADNAAGEWNTVYVKVLNDRVTVNVNGVETAANVILENVYDRNVPAFVEGQLMLIGEGAPIEFREMYMRELPSTPRFELSEEEKKAGFEVLFDGTSMHKWTGNTTDYVPVDGTIYVTAQYGGTGNLYTKKEYSDFVFRFEFAFMRKGVNNGVGVRTPMGVDAAYEGMELQILDHDAPIYKNLREYQQHGSVYGIIAAKRVKFPALGEWNTEEIRFEGDNVKVTVNGEVILEGNIREACQGHNVAPDGGKKNPYTVDKKNHPGLFNKKGHIGFLGHGAGVKFRNIRILDLSK